MTKSLLAIDPGTVSLGWAIFHGSHLYHAGILKADKKLSASNRIVKLIEELNTLVQYREIGAVACERPQGIEDRAPAPQIQTLVVDLRRWARGKKGADWYTYHQSTVKASICPRGMKLNKESVAVGVKAIYGFHTRDDKSPDDVDAVAVGHCHITKEIEKLLEGG